ncbi:MULTISPECIES: sigma-70 family RNA polymerase sigma factor [unclassified Erythrobacter]|uniref:sigma-70 family RNA polymerase sigma factor n=1 Tax=unclassified Erythrobacter TaxID=2633097 RepID=UPI000B2D7B15|nr:MULTISPECIES: sigma-70 family RNA polymerase sigma factor [unclassified Erythrobacter]
MAKGTAGNGNKIYKTTNACPNSVSAAHTSTNNATRSYLTKPQVHAAIAAIDFRANSKLMRMARFRAFTAGIDAEDILQEAILRTLTSRSCPAGLKMEYFLMAVMRSIASAIIARRKRDEARYCSELDLVVSPVAPDEACEIAERSDAWRQAFDDVVAGSSEIERVVDGIDQGLCGKALAEFANTDLARLASVRKTIKRRAARACAYLRV